MTSLHVSVSCRAASKVPGWSLAPNGAVSSPGGQEAGGAFHVGAVLKRGFTPAAGCPWVVWGGESFGGRLAGVARLLEGTPETWAACRVARCTAHSTPDMALSRREPDRGRRWHRVGGQQVPTIRSQTAGWGGNLTTVPARQRNPPQPRLLGLLLVDLGAPSSEIVPVRMPVVEQRC
ncbi:uncharacterized protein LOC143679138 [Tamandua tetradactyla]|uniref:uncharacterized protein LOC143679138 n=1 Tax=Tamandua tetradactyla TaxID=48850 RepID=UPI004053CF4C